MSKRINIAGKDYLITEELQAALANLKETSNHGK